MNTPKLFRLKDLSILSALVLMLVACGEEERVAPRDFVPAKPTLSSGEGHWSVAQRAVAFDMEDEIYFSQFKSKYADDFSIALFNLPIVNQITSNPIAPDQAKPYQPLALAQAQLSKMSAKDLTFDQVAVTVDFMTPFRTKLRSLKLETSNNEDPAFFLTEYRSATIQAFEDLAGLEGISYITVGLNLNQYAYWDDKDGDYSNLVTLYREIYTAIKAKNPKVQVGPSFDWHVLMTEGLNHTAEQYGITVDANQPFDPRLIYLAVDLSIKPFLKDQKEAVFADFVGMSFSVTPTFGQSFFAGSPDPKGDAAMIEKLKTLYQYVPYAQDLSKNLDGSKVLPLVINQIDWEGTAVDDKNRSIYLKLLKSSLSHVEIKWAAWKRLLDIPTDPPELSRCSAYSTNALEPDMPANTNFCYSGLLTYNASPKDVYETLTTNP